MKTYPKLRYPIHTKGLSAEDRMILLAYDIIWRTRSNAKSFCSKDDYFIEDLDANLSNLGHHIEHNLCGMDMALRFEGYDSSSPEDQDTFDKPLEYEGVSRAEMEDEFKKIALNELNKN